MERNSSGQSTWLETGKNKKNSLPAGSHWVGSVGPPETQVFLFVFFFSGLRSALLRAMGNGKHRSSDFFLPHHSGHMSSAVSQPFLAVFLSELHGHNLDL